MRQTRVSIPAQAVRAFCERHRIRRLALFGSVLGDEFRPESDVDILVEFRQRAVVGFLGLMKRATPVMVPPVPTPATNASTSPSVSSQISGAVVL